MKRCDVFGTMDAGPSEVGRFTTWMQPEDKCLGRWFAHFCAKGIPCSIEEREDGKRAVFRTTAGLVRLPAAPTTRAA